MLLPATTLLVLAAAADAVNWLTFTASVPATPSARPVIFLLPMAMPALVTLGPPVIVSPLLFTRVLPMVTLPAAPRSSCFFSATATPFVLAVVVMLLSPVIATVSPSFFTPVDVLPSAVKVSPLVSTMPLASTPFWMSALVPAVRSSA